MSPSNRTHTAKNLLLEMDRMNYDKACLHPISVPFTELARHNINDGFRARDEVSDRFIPFAAVNLWSLDDTIERRLEELRRRGAIGVKYHPEFQYTPPTKRGALTLFRWCARNDFPIIAHTGHTGMEPPWLRKNSEPEAYKEAFKKMESERISGLRIIFAHSGLNKSYKDVVKLAKEYQADHDICLETSGLSVPALKYILANYDKKCIVYESDWPFYPLAVSIARILVATESYTNYRADILHDNAARFLRLS